MTSATQASTGTQLCGFAWSSVHFLTPCASLLTSQLAVEEAPEAAAAAAAAVPVPPREHCTCSKAVLCTCAGMRNDFLIATGTEMALRYNDVSVNENMHASLAHELLYRPSNNFVEHLHEDERRFMRRLIVASILSTDMSVHSELLKVSCTPCLLPALCGC